LAKLLQPWKALLRMPWQKVYIHHRCLELDTSLTKNCGPTPLEYDYGVD
jgi:hypothetical protein